MNRSSYMPLIRFLESLNYEIGENVVEEVLSYIDMLYSLMVEWISPT